jgi:hypothetical protein
MIAEIVAPVLSSWTLRISLWAPFAAGSLCIGFCYCVLIVVPRQDKLSTPKRPTTDAPALGTMIRSSIDSARSNVSRSSKNLKTAMSGYLIFFQNRNMLLVLPTFFVGFYRGITLKMLLQYTSMRFGWKLSDVSQKLFYSNP